MDLCAPRLTDQARCHWCDRSVSVRGGAKWPFSEQIQAPHHRKNSCHCQLGQKGIARKGRKGIVPGGEATDDVLLNGCDVPAKMPTEYSCWCPQISGCCYLWPETFFFCNRWELLKRPRSPQSAKNKRLLNVISVSPSPRQDSRSNRSQASPNPSEQAISKTSDLGLSLLFLPVTLEQGLVLHDLRQSRATALDSIHEVPLMFWSLLPDLSQVDL